MPGALHHGNRCTTNSIAWMRHALAHSCTFVTSSDCASAVRTRATILSRLPKCCCCGCRAACVVKVKISISGFASRSRLFPCQQACLQTAIRQLCHFLRLLDRRTARRPYTSAPNASHYLPTCGALHACTDACACWQQPGMMPAAWLMCWPDRHMKQVWMPVPWLQRQNYCRRSCKLQECSTR